LVIQDGSESQLSSTLPDHPRFIKIDGVLSGCPIIEVRSEAMSDGLSTQITSCKSPDGRYSVADSQTFPKMCLIPAGCSQASRLIVIPKSGSSPISMNPARGAMELSSIAGQSRS